MLFWLDLKICSHFFRPGKIDGILHFRPTEKSNFELYQYRAYVTSMESYWHIYTVESNAFREATMLTSVHLQAPLLEYIWPGIKWTAELVVVDNLQYTNCYS